MKGLYKGKRIDNGEWVEGFYWAKLDPCTLDNSFCNHFIHNGFVFEDKIEVDQKTVSQAIERKDKSDKMIFEGDIVLNTTSASPKEIAIGFVVYTDEYTRFGIKEIKRTLWNGDDTKIRDYIVPIDICSKLEIIGNIHDK